MKSKDPSSNCLHGKNYQNLIFTASVMAVVHHEVYVWIPCTQEQRMTIYFLSY